MDLAKAIGPDCNYQVTGIREGEKIHEEMITSADSLNTYDIGLYYCIVPNTCSFNIRKFEDNYNAKKVEEGFSYKSNTNTEWLSIDQLRGFIA